MKSSIEFYSNGQLIKGHLYSPVLENKAPAIVLAHGFAGVKELLLPAYAEKFAKAGFYALTFDYRGFGESEGERGKIVPNDQILDIRNAITFLTSLKEIDADNIGLWGTSFGGANAIIASSIDKRIKCLSVQLTFGNGERVIAGEMEESAKTKLLATMDKLAVKAVLNNKQMMLPLIKVLTDEQSVDFYKKYVVDFPTLDTKVLFITLKETIEHKPEKALKDVNIPILILGAEKDKVNPVSESKILFELANEPKALHIVKEATHYEVYEGDKLDEAAGKQIEWFKNHFISPN